jgi:hypothetical protein
VLKLKMSSSVPQDKKPPSRKRFFLAVPGRQAQSASRCMNIEKEGVFSPPALVVILPNHIQMVILSENEIRTN